MREREWLMNIRQMRNLTLKSFGQQLGISESYCWMLEKGERQKDMNLTLLTKIADVSDIPLGEIVAMENAYKRALLGKQKAAQETGTAGKETG